MRLANRVLGFAPNPFTELTTLANQYQAVNLGQGFPDWAPPDFVLASIQTALQSASHQYTQPRGVPRLLEAVAALLEVQIGGIQALEEITICVGATQALHVALLALVNPGDEVLLLEPKFDSYTPQVRLCDGVPVFVQLELRNGRWELDLEKMRTAISARTKGIILNSPHNPTGKVFSKTELEAIAAFVEEFDLWVIADEVYDRIALDHPHISFAALPKMRERTVTIGSAGKIFSVTGWRVGWAIAPAKISQVIRAAHQWVPFHVTGFVQEAVAICLETAAHNGYYQQLKTRFLEQRNLLYQTLCAAGFSAFLPEGGYFVVAGVERYSDDVAEFAKYLVKDIGVAAMPVPIFYDPSTRNLAPQALRFAACKKLETIRMAASRLELLAKL
ncbi:MAG: pyridoxal phosphate-dependent aminotransferase [Deinococcales bacterium]